MEEANIERSRSMIPFVHERHEQRSTAAPVVSFAAVFRLVTLERCVTSLKTAAKETTAPGSRVSNIAVLVLNSLYALNLL